MKISACLIMLLVIPSIVYSEEDNIIDQCVSSCPDSAEIKKFIDAKKYGEGFIPKCHVRKGTPKDSAWLLGMFERGENFDQEDIEEIGYSPKTIQKGAVRFYRDSCRSSRHLKLCLYYYRGVDGKLYLFRADQVKFFRTPGESNQMKKCTN